MTFEEFKASLKKDTPPHSMDSPLQALWYDAKGDWDKAHNTAQAIPDQAGSWIHAYLHRKEGDLSNASYWYSRAGRETSGASLEAEWEEIVRTLLE